MEEGEGEGEADPPDIDRSTDGDSLSELPEDVDPSCKDQSIVLNTRQATSLENAMENAMDKDHLRDQQNVVLIHRLSLYAGSIAWKVYQWGPVKCRLYKQVVFIQLVFGVGLTV